MYDADYALLQFNGGFNCAQAVLSSRLAGTEHAEEQALAISSAFGGGMGMRKTCGAVTGALMALGLHLGKTKGDDEEAGWHMSKARDEFLKRFADQFESVTCELLTAREFPEDGLFNPDGSPNVRGTFCVDYVKTASELVAEIVAKHKTMAPELVALDTHT